MNCRVQREYSNLIYQLFIYQLLFKEDFPLNKIMRTSLLGLLIIISAFAFSQQKMKVIVDYYNYKLKYIQEPDKNDSTCKNEINKAKQDIKAGKIVFCTPLGLLFGNIRYEYELEEVVNKYKLKFNVDFISDSRIIGQTQNCYATVMTNYINKKYGVNFREKLYREADSLYIRKVITKNRIVDYWNCDIYPHILNEVPKQDYEITLNIDSLHSPIDCRNATLIDITFVIELDSTTNNYTISNKVFGTKNNEEYCQALQDYSINEVKKINRWCPGRLGNSNIRTRQNVRVFFERTKKASIKRL